MLVLSRLSILATGGLDHHLRLWDPHVTHRPTCILKGHASPVQFIHIDEVENRIVSMSSDMLFKVGTGVLVKLEQ